MTLVMSRMEAKVAYAAVYVVDLNCTGDGLNSLVFILSDWDECAW